MSKLLTEPGMPAQPTEAQIEVPTCPFCGHDIKEIKSRTVAVGQAIVQLLWCGNPDCRKLLPLQVVGQVQQNRIAVPSLVPGRS